MMQPEIPRIMTRSRAARAAAAPAAAIVLLLVAASAGAQAATTAISLSGDEAITLESGAAGTVAVDVLFTLGNFACTENATFLIDMAASASIVAASLDSAQVAVMVPAGIHASYSGKALANVTVTAPATTTDTSGTVNVSAGFDPANAPQGCTSVTGFPAALAYHLITVAVTASPPEPAENETAPPDPGETPRVNDTDLPDEPTFANETVDNEAPPGDDGSGPEGWNDIPGISTVLLLGALSIAGAIVVAIVRRDP